MIPNKTELKQIGSLGGEDVKMTFDQDSLGHLASILIDLYSDRERACIREYSTNALDSHRVAGQTKPIEVTTPSAFSHYFKVKDYGIGLSADDIRNIYSKYGASTGRSNEFANGMYGIGCKSALAYTDQFTITSVKNGIKINVLISRTEDGGGQMSIVSEEQSDEPTGVEVCIPVDKSNDFNNKTREFFKYWNVNDVLINERPPTRGSWRQLSDTLWLNQQTTYYSKPVIVMGGVPYAVDTQQVKLPNDLIAYVDMGAVDFPPNREGLKYTATTKATLEKIKVDYVQAISTAVQKDIDAAPDKRSALRVFTDWRYKVDRYDMKIRSGDFNYKGHALETSISVITRYIHGMGQTSAFDADISSLYSSTIVYDFDKDDLTSYQKRKLNLWASQNNKPESFFFVQKKPDSWWLEEIKKVSWKEILALKLRQGGTKEKPAYDAYIDGKFQTITELDTTKPIFYSTKTEFKRVSGDGQLRLGRTLCLQDVQFVFVAENRIQKFLKLFPTALTLKDGVMKKAEEFKQSLTEGQRARLFNDSYTLDQYSVLDPNRIADVELSDFVKLVRNNKDVSELRKEFNAINSWLYDLTYTNITEDRSDNLTLKTIETRYPLLKYVLNGYGSEKFKNHVYLYIETVYKTEVKETNEVHTR